MLNCIYKKFQNGKIPYSFLASLFLKTEAVETNTNSNTQDSYITFLIMTYLEGFSILRK
jgi:hypothetical protein